MSVDTGISLSLISTHLPETEIVPYNVSKPLGERILVLAPHPDDETLGCGGSIKILSNAGKAIKVIFLTRGEEADPAVKDKEMYASMREEEALNAMKILEISDYEFLRFPDRNLYAQIDKAKDAIVKIVEDFRPDILYSPSMIELNPDHRATADIAMDLLKIFGVRIAFYEIVTPLRPNILVDITGSFRSKRKAIKAYRSQLKITDYQRLISSMNIYRTFTLSNRIRYAEAFWVIDKIAKGDIVSWLSYQGSYEGYERFP